MVVDGGKVEPSSHVLDHREFRGVPLTPEPGARTELRLVVLTAVSACLDAICYLGLGHVFPANMTGNTVLLGVGATTGDLAAASRSATALATFLLAAAVVGLAVPLQASTAAFRSVLVVETVLVAAWCGWWLALGGATPGGAARYGLVALAGAAMGAQSALVRTLGVPVTTTYITGTWTSLSAGSGARLRDPGAAPRGRSRRLQALVVAVYVGTACAAGFAHSRIGAAAAAIPLGLLVLVTASRPEAPPRRNG
ncbi:DUF1275 domain-containing protein [Pseudonocardia sp. RS11V-5]|uniref:YoaK family protein n=1 Tax=Pseudonocardia terrae TaxID=2905831 RepID=UPI001E294C4B|nr:YoaK family protein [Pseudonocardia terrae]MCE3553174.1 DUF1275 domain-containing protein [Pseudonocardia terrae]